MDTTGPAQDMPTHLLPPRNITIIKTRLHINTKQHCHAQALTIVVPKGHGQPITELLMSAHSQNLHHQIPGTFLAKGMINDTNKNFVEEQILLQNKINLHATSLDIYKLSKTLLHQPYTPPNTDNSNPTPTTLYQHILNDPPSFNLKKPTKPSQKVNISLFTSTTFTGASRARYESLPSSPEPSSKSPTRHLIP